jgi:hypothetical protein
MRYNSIYLYYYLTFDRTFKGYNIVRIITFIKLEEVILMKKHCSGHNDINLF